MLVGKIVRRFVLFIDIRDVSKHSDELAKIIGHSDEAKQLKLAIANGANDNITRPMVDKINDIVDSADKIEFKPKATLMDDVAESVTLRLSGKWEKVNEHMSDFSRAYQKQITGREGMAWVQNGVKFDGIKDGILLDAKG